MYTLIQGAIIESLKGRFKELRRPKRNRNSHDKDEVKKAVPKLNKPCVNSLYDLPPIPPGEDEESLQRHAQKLVPEYTKSKKGRGNMQLVTSLMEKTYPIRRADILSGEYDLNTILLRYPYLQCSNQVCIYSLFL